MTRFLIYPDPAGDTFATVTEYTDGFGHKWTRDPTDRLWYVRPSSEGGIGWDDDEVTANWPCCDRCEEWCGSHQDPWETA